MKGSYVALVTPLNEDLSLDKNALQNLIDWHVESGTKGLFIMGTTGEAASLPESVYFQTIAYSLECASGKIEIYAGVTAATTDKVIYYIKELEALQLAGYLVAPPGYIKPPQRALLKHFQEIAAATQKSIVLYNVPGRNCVDMSIHTTAELAKISNVVALKDATGELNRVLGSKAILPKGFSILSGDDATSLAFMKLGGDGVISVTGNIAPKQLAMMCDNALKQNWEAAAEIDKKLQPLHQSLFVEANPIPVKWLLSDMNKIKNTIAPPLVTLDTQFFGDLRNALNVAIS